MVLRLSQEYGTVQNAGEKVVGRTMTTGRVFRWQRIKLCDVLMSDRIFFHESPDVWLLNI